MIYRLGIFASVAFSLAACSANETFSSKLFDGVNKVTEAENMTPSKCSVDLTFESLLLEQNCWTWTVDDIDASNRIGLSLGLAMQKVNGGALEMIEKSNSGITVRSQADGDCHQYLRVDFGHANTMTPEDLPMDVELAIAATKTEYCGKLSKTYNTIES